MDSTQWAKIQKLFNQVLDMEAADRDALLRKIRQDDTDTYEEIVSLLSADNRNKDFTDKFGIAGVVDVIGPKYEGCTVGPYIVETEIGRGAMGVVYKASDSRLDRHVALKFLAGSLAATNSARIRFYTEAKAVSRLDHPNICTIFDIGETDEGALYIAMAYYDGITLDNRLANAPVVLRDAANWLVQIAEGLHFAHGKGVVHRDVKTANVLLINSKHVKILDFGVAKLQGVDVTGPGLRMGTVAYMAPEQLLGDESDHRADIWSLGVVLYEILTGRKPFRGESSGEIANQVIRADIIPVTAIEKWLPPIVDRIVESCLSRDVNARYPDLGEFLQEFGNFQDLISADLKLSSRLVGNAGNGAKNTTEFTHFSEVEKRQITVVSCTLRMTETDGTAAREQAAELSLLLQQQCESYALSEGIAFMHSADTIITLCFGYPRSQEDNSTRALRAAVALREQLLKIIQAEAGANPGQNSVCFGLHTGEAIVDGSGATNIGYIQRLQGDVSVVAGEIQTLADAGDIVVSQSTASMLHEKSILGVAGKMQVTGSSCRIQVHRLSEISSNLGQRREFQPGIDRVLIGRMSERAILTDSWNSVLDGEGRVVTISGEAGIGKSRLMTLASSDLVSRVAPLILRLHCSAYYQHSFLYPFKDWLRNTLAESAGDAPLTVSSDSLCKFLQQHRLDGQRTHHFLAHLLNIDGDHDGNTEGEYTPATPEMRRDYTLQAIVDLVARLSEAAPVLIIFEDLHWADASTLELIQRLVDQGPESQFLLLLSFRPGFAADWLGRSHILQLTIGKLSRKHSEALARDRFGDLKVPADLIRKVVEKSDGIPLFIEELCSMLRHRMRTYDVTNAEELDRGFGELTVPATLRDSLAARLDSNSDYKPIAQLASVIGRRFEYRMISKTWTGEPRVLDAGLEYLVESELLFRTGIVPDAKYAFKHALIQDAAYNSLISSTRARYHKLVVDVIERFFPDVVKQHPEVLAAHYSKALVPERAVPYWLAAASSALQHSALVDAIAQARHGLAALEAFPDGTKRLQLELNLLMTLGPALMAHHSWSLKEVRQSYERARRICEQLGNAPELFPVLYGLYTYHCVVGNHDEGLSLNQLCLQVAGVAEEDGLVLEANMLKGMTHFFFGEFGPALESFEYSAANYKPDKFGDHCYLFGQDPGMVTNSYLAITLAISGRTEQSIAISNRSLEQTRALKHPFSLAYGLTFAAWLHLLIDDAVLGLTLAEEAQELCRKQRIGIMLGMSRLLIGRSAYQQRRYGQASIDIKDGIRQFEALGAGVLMPYWHGFLSEAELAQGNTDSALQAIDLGLGRAGRTREHWSSAELHRIKAGALWQSNERSAEASIEIQKATKMAKSQGTLLFEYRALKDKIGYGAANEAEAARFDTLSAQIALSRGHPRAAI